MYTFALKDLVLYLDIFDDDKKVLKLFHEYSVELDNLKKKYEKSYGPLCSFNSNNDNKWEWINNPWPWDKGGSN